MKDLYLQLWNIKMKKDTNNGKRNSSMVNLLENQNKSEVRRHREG